jgi:four helix bundle protein
MKDEGGLIPLRQRTTAFALRVVRMYSALPKGRLAETLGFQALRSGTSVGGQYREACRGRSDAEVVSKLESVLQELDETSYWLELLVDAGVVKTKRVASLRQEADELMAILVTAVRKIKSRKKR